MTDNENNNYSDYVRRVAEADADADARRRARRADPVEDEAPPRADEATAGPESRGSGAIALARRLFGGDRVLWVIIISLRSEEHTSELQSQR